MDENVLDRERRGRRVSGVEPGFGGDELRFERRVVRDHRRPAGEGVRGGEDADSVRTDLVPPPLGHVDDGPGLGDRQTREPFQDTPG
ncbi:hypothetical protein [Marinactinospora rubrisoli]|uniref:Uncharacterized protein n=1 Tax=Marinactinospora rubrisoli TaxID=2715399 RepID=A0ABW2KAP9_9ACTN